MITNSDYYLEQIPRYVRGELTRAVPVGHAHDPRRSDGPREALSRISRRTSTGATSEYEPIDCNACFYACRGEAQAPLRLSRVRDVMA